MAGSCRVFLLDGFRVEVDGAVIPPTAWRHRRGADVVKLLALAPGHRLHRDRVIDALWPDLSPDAGAANLRKAIHFARGVLGREAVEARAEMVELWPGGGLEVDAELMETATDEEAVELHGGGLLPEDEYETWTQGPRERLRRRYAGALKSLGRWEQAVEVDPLDEASYRELMRADLEMGDRQGAMRRFERLRQTLHEEVGVGPDPATVALYEEVLALEGTEPATPEERARAHLAAGLLALNREELAEAEREAATARTLAIEAGLGKELGEASGLLGMVAHMQGRWNEVFRRESLGMLKQAPSLLQHVLDAHLCLAEYSLHGPGGAEEAEALATELLDLAEKHGSVLGTALAELMLGERELIAGRLDAADEHLGRAAARYSEMETASAHALATERLAEVELARDRPEEAVALLDEAHRLALDSPLVSHLLVRVHGARVQAARTPEQAMASVREAESELEEQEVCDPCSMAFLAASAIAASRAGDAARAAKYLRDAERVSGFWQGGAWASAVWEARAELRLSEDEPAQAAALFREAAEGFARAGYPLAEARCRAAAGDAGRLAV